MNYSESKNLLQVISQIIDNEESYSFMRKSGLDYYRLKSWGDENARLLGTLKPDKLKRFIEMVKSGSPNFSGYNEKDFSNTDEKREMQFNQLRNIANQKNKVSENLDLWLPLTVLSTTDFFGELSFAFSFNQLIAENGISLSGEQNSLSEKAAAHYLVDKKQWLAKYESQPKPEGRNTELRKILGTLLCFENNNVLLAGLPGSGKSSLVDKMALHILGFDTKGFFDDMKLVQLDYIRLMGECQSKNEAEKKLLEIVRQYEGERMILIIEDIQYLCDKTQGLPGAFMILKQLLSNNNIRVVATCSLASLKKTFNADESFIRNFNVIEITEPDDLLLKSILKSRAAFLQQTFNIKINPAAIDETIALAKKYFREATLPFSAIQLLEKTLAGISLNADNSHKQFLAHVCKAYLADMQAFEKENSSNPDVIENYRMKLVNNLNHHINNLTGYSLFDDDFKNVKDAGVYFNQLDNIFTDYLTKLDVTELLPLHVAATCSLLTGIPAGKITQNEHDKLSNLAGSIRQSVRGQDHAIDLIVRKLKTWRMNLSTSRTVGSFFLLGPTGTGKTEFTKALAANLFDDANAFIRFDMSEFKEEHSAALLIGAPPGYVGYEEGGLLVNKIRQKPYAVVLFDEIEKAHHTVFDLFLQIMDEGKLHDKLGFEGDFSNAIIIFTSNIASNKLQEAARKKPISEITQAELTEMVNEYARETHYIIKPEFLGRLSAIVPFSPIGSVLNEILDLNIDRFRKKLYEEHRISLDIKSTFVEHLVSNNLEFEKYGARKIKHTVQTELIEPIGEYLFNNKDRDGNTLVINYTEDINIDCR